MNKENYGNENGFCFPHLFFCVVHIERKNGKILQKNKKYNKEPATDLPYASAHHESETMSTSFVWHSKSFIGIERKIRISWDTTLRTIRTLHRSKKTHFDTNG